jgi:aminopeptidase N
MNHAERSAQFSCSRLRESSAAGKFARPGSKPSYAPDQAFDAQHILLELSLDVPKKTVHGRCTTTFRAITGGSREIRFDAAEMKILSVTLEPGRKLPVVHKDERLTVRLPSAPREEELVTVSIEYRLVDPIAGVYFVGPDRAYPKKPVQVWTHGEAEESRYWFPCFDAPHDKAVTEMLATVPKDFFALSNGALVAVNEDKSKKTKTYHWKQSIPHSPYLVTLVAGKFSEIRDEWDGLPVQYYCEPGREEDTKRAFGKTPKMIEFFSDKIGVRYPYEKYAQIAVADFVMGGMEHTTATTQTDRVLMDAKAFPEFTADWLVSHELAHQWFGDLLTCKEWSHAWLNESFATYFEALFTEHDLGDQEFQFEMWEKLRSYLDEDSKVYRRAIVTNVYKKPDDLFDRHLYEKGSLVLHMLRHLLGDELWWKSIHHYVAFHQAQAVETVDLINSIQASTGRNFRKFFDQWVFGPGHADYLVNYWWDAEKKTAHVRVLQRGGLQFSVPVELEFVTARGSKKFTETVEEKKHEFSYRFDAEPLDFRFDPRRAILKVAEVVKPYRMWVKQLETDSNPVGRSLAAREVAKVPTEESVEVLSRAFRREKFWGAAKEIAVALGTTGLESARRFLIGNLAVKHPKTRRGVVEALSHFKDADTVARLTRVAERDASYFVSAEAVRSLAETLSPRAEASVRKALRRPSWNETIAATAVSSLSKSPTQSSVGILRQRAKYGESPSVRGAAVQALSRCARNFPELFADLLALAQEKPGRVKNAAISVLGSLKDPRAVPVLEKISKDKRLAYRTQALAQDALLKITPENGKD